MLETLNEFLENMPGSREAVIENWNLFRFGSISI